MFAQHRLSTAVNSAMVTTYWEIGEQIFKACGENDRAEYGKKLLEYLSEQLTAEFGKGFDKSNLRKMRQFYCTFPIRDTLCPELSWSHYRVLMRINDEQARRFYMEECAKAAWSVRQLERQINTMYYQRILASRDKIAVANEIQTTEPKPEYEKIVKDPYVMEFLQIQPDTHVYEGDLEQALIDHLQHFLLELGRGFSFVARQKRFTLDGQDFFIDLVFYNYILKCFVLIDLKMGKLTHQDLGQMQMYVNYYMLVIPFCRICKPLLAISCSNVAKLTILQLVAATATSCPVSWCVRFTLSKALVISPVTSYSPSPIVRINP